MTFDDWWDSGPRITDPATYRGWEASCRAAWNAGARESAAELARLRAELDAMTARKDDAYRERNKVVRALAAAYPSGIARTAIEGWSDDWHGCVYIDLPTGQVSWHYHDSEAALFAALPAYPGAWDGHDTPEKYRRLAALDSRHDDAARLRAELERVKAAGEVKRAALAELTRTEPPEGTQAPLTLIVYGHRARQVAMQALRTAALAQEPPA